MRGLPLQVLLLGCGAPAGVLPTGGPSSGTDGGAAPSPNDGAPPADLADLAVPAGCPCPAESFCDLATNRCQPGCLAPDGCAAGRYCDLPTRQCKTGCVDDKSCAAGQVCDESHACVLGCRSCGAAGDLCAEGELCSPSQSFDPGYAFACVSAQCRSTTAVCNGFYAPAYGFWIHAGGKTDPADDCHCAGAQLSYTLLGAATAMTVSCPRGCRAWTSPDLGGKGMVDTHYGCF